MKKYIFLSTALLLAFCFHVSAQCLFQKLSEKKKSCGSEKSSLAKKSFSQKSNSTQAAKWIPFAEASYQLGLCGEGNPVAFTAGAEKRLSKHVALSGDVQAWKTNYEVWGADLYSVGKYSAVIPSVKIKLDPGKQYKGFFVGAGIGYAIARDRGTEQSFTETTSGVKTPTGEVTEGNWDYNSIAPSFNWGVAFKIHRLPMSIVNTNYFAKTTEGWAPISTGIGLRMGLMQVPKAKKSNCGSSYQRIKIVSESKSKAKIEQKKKSCAPSSSRCGRGN